MKAGSMRTRTPIEAQIQVHYQAYTKWRKLAGLKSAENAHGESDWAGHMGARHRYSTRSLTHWVFRGVRQALEARRAGAGADQHRPLFRRGFTRLVLKLPQLLLRASFVCLMLIPTPLLLLSELLLLKLSKCSSIPR